LLVESRLPDEQHEYGHVEHSLFVSVRDFRDFINNVAEHEQQSRQRQQPQPQPQNYQHQHVDRESAESAEQTTTDQDPDLNRFTICFDNGMKRVSMYSLSAIPQHLTLHLINKALHAHKPSDESI
jgi:hypothetical protein